MAPARAAAPAAQWLQLPKLEVTSQVTESLVLSASGRLNWSRLPASTGQGCLARAFKFLLPAQGPFAGQQCRSDSIMSALVGYSCSSSATAGPLSQRDALLATAAFERELRKSCVQCELHLLTKTKTFQHCEQYCAISANIGICAICAI